jgi:hypothetical protein
LNHLALHPRAVCDRAGFPRLNQSAFSLVAQFPRPPARSLSLCAADRLRPAAPLRARSKLAVLADKPAVLRTRSIKLGPTIRGTRQASHRSSCICVFHA